MYMYVRVMMSALLFSTSVSQSESSASPSDAIPPSSLPALPEGAMGDNDEYQEITEGVYVYVSAVLEV